jgi:hypothetical protein
VSRYRFSFTGYGEGTKKGRIRKSFESVSGVLHYDPSVSDEYDSLRAEIFKAVETVTRNKNPDLSVQDIRKCNTLNDIYEVYKDAKKIAEFAQIHEACILECDTLADDKTVRLKNYPKAIKTSEERRLDRERAGKPSGFDM